MDKQPLSQEVLKEKLGSCEEQRFEILLAHNPIYFSEYVEWGADLILSGHVHGGVAKIPFLGGVIAPSFQLFPKYDGGKFQELGKDGRIKTMILSRGLGAHTIPIRIFNPGELVVVKIQKEGE